MERGQALAASCSEFDYAIQNLTQAASVPTIPVMGARFVKSNNLLLESDELTQTHLNSDAEGFYPGV